MPKSIIGTYVVTWNDRVIGGIATVKIGVKIADKVNAGETTLEAEFKILIGNLMKIAPGTVKVISFKRKGSKSGFGIGTPQSNSDY